MDSGLKQRLLGAAVLIALAIIFVPMFLGNAPPRETSAIQNLDIPPLPERKFETRTLPVAVYNMISFDQLSWGPLAAAALIVTFPVLLLTMFAQRQIVAGLTAGAVKGG